MSQDDKTGKDWSAILEEEGASTETESPEPIAGVLDHPDYKALATQLTEMEQKAHENWDKALRAMSELDNVRRRAEQQVQSASKFANEKLIKALLPVLDSLEQALLAGDPADGSLAAMREGIDLTYKLLLSSLGKAGIQQLDPMGALFDPNQHEAMTSQVDASVPVNTIVAVFQKGYVLHDRVVRPARVVVSKQS